MKKALIMIVAIAASNVLIAQITPNSKPIKQDYKSLNLNRYSQPLANKQAAYNQNYKYLLELMDFINSLKSEIDEWKLNYRLDEQYKILKEYEKKDLSLLYKELKQIEINIFYELDLFDKRMEAESDPKKYWQLGIDFYDAHNYSKAIENFNIVIELSPEFMNAYLFRGISYCSIGNYSAAVRDLSAFIENDKTDYQSFLYRGWSYSSLSNNESALLDMNKSIELNTSNAYSYYSRGNVLSDMELYDKAIIDYKKAITLQPDFSMAYNNLAWVKFLQKEFSQALIFADQAVKLDGSNYVALDTRAEIKFNLNNYKGSTEDATSALLLNPKIANCYLLKGRSYFKQGKKDEACEEWQKAIDLGNFDALDYSSQYCK